MSNQVSMSVRLDKGVREALTMEAQVSCCKANRIINDGVRIYCEIADTMRQVSTGSISQEDARKFIYDRWSKYIVKAASASSRWASNINSINL